MKQIVAYPGPLGSHSSAACARLAPDAESVGFPSFSAVVDAAVRYEVSFGVLPIESSLSGPVAQTHDLLYASPVSIFAEALLPIRHCLVGTAHATTELRVIRSHPEAFDQCRRLLAALPDARRVPAATTADAAREVAESADRTEAAIASEHAAQLYGLNVIDADVADHPEAFTRFIAFAPDTRLTRDDRPWRTALTFVTDHAPGALYRALEPFARHQVDLVQLVSRPLARSRWRYRFDAVLDGHPLDSPIRQALAELRTLTRELRVTGSYAAGEDA